jgi:pyruvate dehydrogenase E2 component (dihydrolipoamide acetyltransferase)
VDYIDALSRPLRLHYDVRPMSIEFKLPSIGEGVESADVAEILVSEGDTVAEGQVVAELETEKAVVELPCPHAGRVARVHVSEGDTISVGQTFLTIEETAGLKAGAKEDAPKPAQVRDRADAKEPAAPPAAALKGDTLARREGKIAAESDGTRSVPPTSAAPKRAATLAAGEAKRIEFQLPGIGEGVESADVAEIHVRAGDTIAAEQVVMDLETEKAVIELPCPFAGTIEKVHVSVGDTVTVGQTLFTLVSRSAEVPVPAQKPAAPAKPAPQPRQAEPGPSAAPRPSPVAKAPSPPAAGTAVKAAPARTAPAAPEDADGDGHPPVPASPSTRRLARQLGVNLREVKGHGPGGRITREDVQAYIKDRLQAPAQVPAVKPAAAMMAGSLAPPPLPDFSRFGVVEREKLSKLARTAAENLTVSWHVIPHVTQHDRADVTELEAARKKFAAGVGKDGPRVTMTAIAIKALAKCLQAFPKFNSSLDPETSEIAYKRYYHIGCAVDTPHGLLVPVIRDCDRKSIVHIAAELAQLAEQARDRKLAIESMQGATCTVTNLGGIGGVAFTPIVNYPEVCILGMSRTQTELRLVEGQVQERLMLPLALSYDHRVINGADAARFVAALCNLLSDPFQLLSAI